MTRKTIATAINPTSVLYPVSILISLWWTWRESNPRPEVLRFEGITTILYLLLRLLVALALEAAFVRAARALTNLPILISVWKLIVPVHDPPNGVSYNCYND